MFCGLLGKQSTRTHFWLMMYFISKKCEFFLRIILKILCCSLWILSCILFKTLINSSSLSTYTGQGGGRNTGSVAGIHGHFNIRENQRMSVGGTYLWTACMAGMVVYLPEECEGVADHLRLWATHTSDPDPFFSWDLPDPSWSPTSG